MPRLSVRALAVAALVSIGPSPLHAIDAYAADNDEAKLLAAPSAAGALATSREENSLVHYAGTPGDYAFAVYMRDRLASDGFAATIEAFRGPIDHPRTLALALIDDLGRPLHDFDLREGPIAGDPDGTRPGIGIPFNYGSGSGDVRAPLRVAGRGLDADYAALAAHHRPIRGCIAIVRYGAEFRGLLAARAQRNGAAGVIFYSDPRDDRARPDRSVQRGTVGAARLGIPTLPVSLQTARVLLAAAAKGMRARLRVDLYRETGTMWNTVGILRGRSPEEVVLGGHRDAWVYGVTDNGSGIATLLEVAHAFGTLAKSGWRPQRTIVIAGFDAEEIGELGSRAYVRMHRAELDAHALAYINEDEVVTGTRFSDDAAGALSAIVTSTARSLGIAKVPDTASVPGGGSDHESFLFAPGPGIPTAEVGFAGHLGTYHSAYDDLHFALATDPGFALHREIARVVALLIYRLSQTPSPYAFTPYVDEMRDAQAELLSDPAVVRSGADPNVFGPLDAAIAHFSVAAHDVDTTGAKRPLSDEIRAARSIDTTLYGATGYGVTGFPAIRAAVASGDATAIGKSAAAATQAIDAAADLLSPSSS
jgi:N-acetylated-alpha-linked acidic dipeptidase